MRTVGAAAGEKIGAGFENAGRVRPSYRAGCRAIAARALAALTAVDSASMS